MNKDFEIENGVLKKYIGNNKDVIIPEGVIKIGQDCFKDAKIKSLKCPSTLKTISYESFYYSQIEEIIFNDNLETIKKGAFMFCQKLKKIKLPDNIKIIEDYTFSHSALEEIIIPNNLKTIESCAFLCCENLKEINLNNVEIIKSKAFKNCASLKKVENYNIKNIELEAFCDCVKLEKFNFDNVTLIGEAAFRNCNFKELYLKNIENIDEYSFSKNFSLKNINLENIKKINKLAFRHCKMLKDISLKQIDSINNAIFCDCDSITNIKLEKDSFKEINGLLFFGCNNLKTIEFKDNYDEPTIKKIIGTKCYNLTEVKGPNIICEDSVVYNEDKSHLISYLDGKKDKYFKIPDNVTKILKHSINNDYLETLEFGKNVEKIENDGINSSSIKEIKFNEKLETLGECSLGLFNQELEILDFTKTKLTKFNVLELNISNPIFVKLPDNLKSIFGYDDFITLEIKNKKNIDINTTCTIIERDKTLEELINEGKTFREASQIIKEQEK